MRIEAYSTKGMRKTNQDSYLLMNVDSYGVEETIAVVCDGMGGTDDGFFASNMLIMRLQNLVEFGDYSISKVNDVVQGFHNELKGREKTSGTTITFLATDGDSFSIYHIGDSRCYSFFDEGYSLLTEDHSVRNEARLGRFGSRSKYFINYKENVLSRCVGIGENPKPFIKTGKITSEKGFMLCSDGFWHLFNENDRLNNLEEYCNNVIFNGEDDNITVLKVTF